MQHQCPVSHCDSYLLWDDGSMGQAAAEDSKLSARQVFEIRKPETVGMAQRADVDRQESYLKEDNRSLKSKYRHMNSIVTVARPGRCKSSFSWRLCVLAIMIGRKVLVVGRWVMKVSDEDVNELKNRMYLAPNIWSSFKLVHCPGKHGTMTVEERVDVITSNIMLRRRQWRIQTTRKIQAEQSDFVQICMAYFKAPNQDWLDLIGFRPPSEAPDLRFCLCARRRGHLEAHPVSNPINESVTVRFFRWLVKAGVCHLLCWEWKCNPVVFSRDSS